MVRKTERREAGRNERCGAVEWKLAVGVAVSDLNKLLTAINEVTHLYGRVNIEIALRRKIMAEQKDNGIKAGDVVMLKSDGLKMTVANIEPGSSSDAENFAHGIWFDRGRR
jgi:uncharacterized protein YodC (DUF2158 family)